MKDQFSVNLKNDSPNKCFQRKIVIGVIPISFLKIWYQKFVGIWKMCKCLIKSQIKGSLIEISHLRLIESIFIEEFTSYHFIQLKIFADYKEFPFPFNSLSLNHNQYNGKEIIIFY